jgi:hypothetical protein
VVGWLGGWLGGVKLKIKLNSAQLKLKLELGLSLAKNLFSDSVFTLSGRWKIHVDGGPNGWSSEHRPRPGSEDPYKRN